VPSSAVGSVLESVLGSVLESVVSAYSQARLECAIESNWERPGEHARECTWERLESLLECVSQAAWEVCHREQMGASLRASPGVYLGASCELT